MTKETKVGLVIGLGFMVGVVYVLSLFTSRPSDQEQQVLAYRPQHKQIEVSRPATKRIPLSASKKVEQPIVKPPATVQVVVPKKKAIVPLAAVKPIFNKTVVPSAPKPQFHVVKEGETLTDIALKFYKAAGENELNRIHKANAYKMPNRDMIWPGLKLLIPPIKESRRAEVSPAKTKKALTLGRARTYTVMPGDTLSEISSRKLGTMKRWREIRKLNRDKLPTERTPLQVGMILKLPVRSRGTDSRLPKTADDLWR